MPKILNDELLQKKIGWVPHKNQQVIIENKSREKVICAGRGFGKSATAAYIALKYLLIPNKEIAIISPTYDLTDRVFKYLEEWIAKGVPALMGGVTSRVPASIHTTWNTNLLCKSAENPTGILGKRYDLVIVDEASIIKRDVFNRHIYPTTSAGGKIVFISTPFGKNFFYEEWLSAKRIGGAFHFTSKDNPYVKPEEWERAKNKLPEQVFKQEYEALFLDDAAAVFRGVNRIVNEDCLTDSIQGHFYIMGVDLAKFNDFSVITVIDTATKAVVFIDRFKDIDYPFQKKRIIATAMRYNNARIVVDSTGVGQPIKDDLEREGLFIEDFHFTGKSKKELVEKLSIFIEQGIITIPNDLTLLDELTSFGYQLTDAGNIKYSAPQGLHDDCVMSLALATWQLTTEKPSEHNALKEKLKTKVKKKQIKSYI